MHVLPEDLRAKLSDYIARGRGPSALARLRQYTGSGGPYGFERKLVGLVNELDKGQLPLTPVRIAILASHTVDHFIDVLRTRLLIAGYDADVYVGEFDTITQTVFDKGSELYGFQPDLVWLFTTHRDAHFEVAPLSNGAAISSAIDAEISAQEALVAAIRSNSSATVVVNNADMPTEEVFGNFESSALWAPKNLFRQYNLRLAERMRAAAVIFDLEAAANKVGQKWFDPRYWHHSKHAFAFDAYGLLAYRFSRLLVGAQGRSAKCLVLDLDNTLWGGVIGDDGLDGIAIGYGAGDVGEAHLALQRYALGLRSRGIVLAVCSKNEEDTAKLPFQEHPDMLLKLDHITVFAANWQDKASNLRNIAEQINIRTDALVFVDDNPAEREIVRELLPDVWVPEITDDPASYVEILNDMRYFELISFESEDTKRADLYTSNQKRQESRQSFANLDAYLDSLEMVATISSTDGISKNRALQLLNKSNQFNLDGRKVSDAEMAGYLAKPDHFGFCFRLEDRFGDNGIISTVLFHIEERDLYIDSWVMSCRVLARGVEEYIIGILAEFGEERGARTLRGHWRSSGRNGLVKTLYEKLNFDRLDDSSDDLSFWQVATHAAPRGKFIQTTSIDADEKKIRSVQ